MMIAFLIASTLMAAPRPTADEVVAAVKASRQAFAEKFAKAHVPPTAESMIEGLNKKLEKAEKRRAEVMKMPTGKQRAPLLKEVVDEIKSLKEAIADVKSGKTQPAAPPEPARITRLSSNWKADQRRLGDCHDAFVRIHDLIAFDRESVRPAGL